MVASAQLNKLLSADKDLAEQRGLVPSGYTKMKWATICPDGYHRQALWWPFEQFIR
jgi:hypothetical protein